MDNLKLKDIFPLLSKNQPIKIVTFGKNAMYNNAHEIPKDMIDGKLVHIAHDKDGIILYVEKMWYSYDNLDTKSKINALYTFMHLIEYFDNWESIEELEDCVREFWSQSEYTLDKNGNWYDEDFQKI